MSAPVPAEQVSVQSGPIELPGVATGRAGVIAGVVVGGVLLVLDVALLIWAAVIW